MSSSLEEPPWGDEWTQDGWTEPLHKLIERNRGRCAAKFWPEDHLCGFICDMQPGLLGEEQDDAQKCTHIYKNREHRLAVF